MQEVNDERVACYVVWEVSKESWREDVWLDDWTLRQSYQVKQDQYVYVSINLLPYICGQGRQ